MFTEKYVLRNERLPFYLRVTTRKYNYFTIKEFTNRNGTLSRIFYLAYILLAYLILGSIFVYSALSADRIELHHIFWGIIGSYMLIRFIFLTPFTVWLARNLSTK